MNDERISQTLAEFVGAFEVVFRYDWDHTKLILKTKFPFPLENLLGFRARVWSSPRGEVYDRPQPQAAEPPRRKQAPDGLPEIYRSRREADVSIPLLRSASATISQSNVRKD